VVNLRKLEERQVALISSEARAGWFWLSKSDLFLKLRPNFVVVCERHIQVPIKYVSHRRFHLVQFSRRALDVIVEHSGHISVESHVFSFTVKLGGESQAANYHTVCDLSVKEKEFFGGVLDGTQKVNVSDAQGLFRKLQLAYHFEKRL
jgi:hypothetical protein